MMFPVIAMSAMALLMGFVPPQDHAWRGEPSDETLARYWRVAKAIAEVAEEAPIDGDVDATVRLLAVTAASESALRADVIACRVAGDGGRVPAWGAFGLARRKAMVCGALVDAARVALEMLRVSLETCARVPRSERLAFFLSGDPHCQRGAAQSRYRWSLIQREHQS